MSMSGYTLMLNGADISWKSKRLQKHEFVAAWYVVQEVIYTLRLLEKLGLPQPEPTQVFEGNGTCIALSEGLVEGSD